VKVTIVFNLNRGPPIKVLVFRIISEIKVGNVDELISFSMKELGKKSSPENSFKCSFCKFVHWSLMTFGGVIQEYKKLNSTWISLVRH